MLCVDNSSKFYKSNLYLDPDISWELNGKSFVFCSLDFLTDIEKLSAVVLGHIKVWYSPVVIFCSTQHLELLYQLLTVGTSISPAGLLCSERGRGWHSAFLCISCDYFVIYDVTKFRLKAERLIWTLFFFCFVLILKFQLPMYQYSINVLLQKNYFHLFTRAYLTVFVAV